MAPLSLLGEGFEGKSKRGKYGVKILSYITNFPFPVLKGKA